MMTFKQIFLLFVTLYALLFFIVTNFFSKDLKAQDDSVFMASKTFLITQENNGFETQQRPVQNKTASKTTERLKYLNPFELLGAYPDPTPYLKKPMYNKPHYGLTNEDDYCYQVDLYNLANPANMFKKMNFYTDYPKGSLMKARVMNQLGTIYMPQVHRYMPKRASQLRKHRFDKRVTAFHVAGDGFYNYHEVGKHYLCATQMFNHILNHTNIIRKDAFLQNFADYSLMYKNKPQCFDENSFFPTTYRLFVKNECQEFFNIIKSAQYQKSLKTEPIQYLLKVGHGAHRAQGVFLIDEKKTKELYNDYNYGKKCGDVDNALIVQKYIANPLLLDLNNKFHMRVYLLIASTNPFIAYYHDGYIRGSIFPFDKSSSHRATHLTNLPITSTTAISKTINGMNAKQLEDYYLWSFEDLQNYLLESGKITDKKWLDNHLRPALQKAFVHVVRMTGGSFWKQSNVYELLGCDFMLDDEMNVWFIEANPSPLLDGVRPKMIANMLKNMFEIQYAYYRSRMNRVIAVIQKLGEDGDLDKWKGMYQKAVRNRLEPEYQIKKTNTFKLIMDESLPGAKAYLGYIPEECL